MSVVGVPCVMGGLAGRARLWGTEGGLLVAGKPPIKSGLGGGALGSMGGGGPRGGGGPC